jgi:indole-3-glycerol phosphate synthase
VATSPPRAATYLDNILAWHRARAAADTRDVLALRSHAQASSVSDPVRPFAAALKVGAVPGRPAVIAEIKRRSPSKGDLALELDPASVARDYAAGGAAALSVLSDEAHFAAKPGDLQAARAATKLPVLRKDFTVSANDISDARLIGADAVLLIVAALSDGELSEFLGLATQLGLTAVVEAHDEAEAERALSCGAAVIGVNQRDLRTFEVDTARAVRVAAALPGNVVKVAESGIRSVDDIDVLAAAGYDAILVGESFVTSPDRRRAVAGFSGAAV